MCVCAKFASVKSSSFDCMDCSPPGSSLHADSPGENTGVGCHTLFEGIYLTQGWNLCLLRLLHWQAGSLSTTWEAPHCSIYITLTFFFLRWKELLFKMSF